MEIRVAYYKWPTHISSKLFNVKTNTHLNCSYLRDITSPGDKLSPNKRKPIIWTMLISCASEYLNHKTAISFQRSSFLNVFKHTAIMILWFKMFALSYIIQYRKSRQWQQIAAKPIRDCQRKTTKSWWTTSTYQSALSAYVFRKNTLSNNQNTRASVSADEILSGRNIIILIFMIEFMPLESHIFL